MTFFISHPGNGDHKQLFASPLKRMLCAYHHSINVWLDKDSIRPGMSSMEAIERALSTAEVIVVAIDDTHYLQSHFCMLELKTALDRVDDRDDGCRIIPVFLSPRESIRENARQLKPPEWDSGEVFSLIERVVGFSGFCVTEDKFLTLAHIAAAIGNIAETGAALTSNEIEHLLSTNGDSRAGRFVRRFGLEL